ncbi:iron ABC transporter permease [Clostridium sp. AWRP]|uniref:ABC transporter permease n=1 Tax=Clostridium sp. AWRP TaxID=2212991 RepID=UPI001A9B5CE9|nr:iron ABC transporter permease [Clostridium sp. AWRP]
MSFKVSNGYSLGNYGELLKSQRTILSIKNTIIIGAVSNLISMLLGAIFAFMIAYTNIKRKKLMELLVLLPFIIPSYIVTLSWSNLLLPNGTINNIIAKLGMGKINIYSIPGIVFVLGISNVPIVYLITLNMLRKIPRDLEWASRVLGYNKWETLYKINLPQVMPALIGGGILSFLAAIDNFAVPAFLGISSGIPVLSTYIYEKAIAFGPASFNYAAVLSVIISIIAIVGTVLQGLLVKKSINIDSIKDDYSVRIEFSKNVRKSVEIITFVFLTSINIIPIITMITSSFQKAYGTKFTLKTISFENYSFLFNNEGVRSSILNSLVLATTATIFCIIIGTFIAYIKVRKDSESMKLGEMAATLTYAVPGIVLALAMIFHWVEPLPGIRPGIYGTIKILIIAYVTRYLILQIKGSTSAVITVEETVEEAARVAGASKIKIWFNIMIPLLSKQVLSSAFLIYISAMTELTISSMLASAGTKTIGLTIFNFQQAGNYNISSAMSTIIVLLVLTIYFIPKLIKIKNFRGDKDVN